VAVCGISGVDSSGSYTNVSLVKKNYVYFQLK
jgi:hypothetical protein